MEELAIQMKKVLADSFSLYLKAHYYHWNVTGPLFPMYHDFFGDFYEEVFESVDSTAEQIRSIGAFAPGSYKRFMELSSIMGEEQVNLDPLVMVQTLYEDNNTVIESLKEANRLAEETGSVGLANYLQDRIDKHFKHKWMLSAQLKRT